MAQGHLVGVLFLVMLLTSCVTPPVAVRDEGGDVTLEIICHDSYAASILRARGWRESIDEEVVPQLEAEFKSKDVPATLHREGNQLRVRVDWQTGCSGAYDPD